MSNGQEPQDLYKPSPEIVANANVKSYEEMARWAEGDLAGFWAAQAEQFVWFQPWDKVLDDSNKPFYKWFVGGKTNIVYNCLDRHLRDLAAQQAGADLGGRERRGAHLLLPRAQPRGVQVRQRPAQHGRQEGRPGDHLHGPRARAAHRHAGLRQDRRGALGGLRRLLGRGAARPHRGQPVQRRHHLRRRLHERQDRRAQEDHGRGDQARRAPSSTSSSSSAPATMCRWRRAATTGITI